jgi:hypothetical protein
MILGLGFGAAGENQAADEDARREQSEKPGEAFLPGRADGPHGILTFCYTIKIIV